MHATFRIALVALISVSLATPAHAANALKATFNLLGINQGIKQQGNRGQGITFGVIDTGVESDWAGFFNGRIDTNNSGCTISGCVKDQAINDDNGHGSFVASEIVGKTKGSFAGVAPGAKVIAVKALNSSGSGLVGDVANGITHVVNKGAKIVNLSLTFVPTSALISAINSAANKGALIVFAGGNDGGFFQNNQRISGLTDKAIQSLLFVGSTNISKSASYFSTKPGTGGFVSTSGKFYSYASRWVMAHGEGIYGASTYNDGVGYNYMTVMSGTSMAAPLAAGVAGLVAGRWPFLVANGTLGQILIDSAQDLGASGADGTYGSGLINATTAFTPMGQLTVPVNGTNIPVSQAQMQVNGTVSGQAISTALSKGVGYDKYKRDFSLNLGAGITNTNNTSVTMNVYQGSAGSQSGRSFTDLGDGKWLTTSFVGGSASEIVPSNVAQRGGFLQDPNRPAQGNYSAGFYSQGTYIGGGMGGNAAYSFNDARWGEKNAFFDSDMAGAGNLLNLQQGGSYAAAGFDLSKTERLSFGVVMGGSEQLNQLIGNEVSSQGFTVGYTWKPGSDWGVSFTGSFLKEKNSLLGTASSGYLKVGENATSMAFGLSSSFDIGDGLMVGFDGTLASTNPGENKNSLITNTSRLTSAGFGLTMRKENLTGVGDTLVASFKAPLRVLSGSANLNIPVGSDENGNAVFERARASLSPEGMETTFSLGYTRPVDEKTMASFAFEFRNDANNVQGQTDHAVMFRLTKGF